MRKKKKKKKNCGYTATSTVPVAKNLMAALTRSRKIAAAAARYLAHAT